MTPETHVILSTFPPLHCGIARYAAQHVEYLRRQGKHVVTIGLPGSEADAVVDARGGRNALRVLKALRSMGVAPERSSLSIHWHDGHYFAGGFSERIPTALTLRRLFAAFGETEIICHETYVPEEVGDAPRRLLRAVYRWARRRAWLRATRLAFHSEAERRKAEEAHGGRWPDHMVVIRGHSAFLFKHRDVGREEARRELGIPKDAFLFLCIGFISEHKGYDLAMEAMRRLENPQARLAVVGSVREPTERDVAYAARLRELAAGDPRIDFREQFVSDEEYDTWNAAADVIVAPYLNAFSSSVVARAKLFGRRVITTDVGGLVEQVGVEDMLVRSSDELVTAMISVLDDGWCA